LTRLLELFRRLHRLFLRSANARAQISISAAFMRSLFVASLKTASASGRTHCKLRPSILGASERAFVEAHDRALAGARFYR
jgi:hypothetical protein